MLFALCVLALAATAGSAAAALRLAVPGFVLAAYLIGVAEVVLLTEVLSVGRHVGASGYFLLELPLLVAAVALWHRAGRPRPSLPRIALESAVRAHPVLAALALAVAAALLYEAFLVLTVPPTTWDGLTYHLSRAAAWRDFGAVDYVPAHTTRENVLPPNAEIQILYTFVLLGRDVLAAAPQLLAQLALLVAIYGCARRLGFARPASLFAALLYASTTEVALQATSTQNDLAVAALVAAAVYFVLGAQERELPLAGLALGLAAGTKLTIAPAVPALVLVAALVLSPRLLLRTAAWSAAAFLLVGAWGYAQNLSEDGRPLGISPEAESFRPERTAGDVVSTSVRVLFDFVDLSGLHAPVRVQEAIADVTQGFFEFAHVDPNPPAATSREFSYWPNTWSDEDLSYFGPLGILLVLPLALGFAGAGLASRTDALRAALAWSLPIFVIGVAVTHKYNPWIGRFMTMPVALVLPLAAVVYARRYLSAALAAVAVVTLACAHAFNVAKLPRQRPWNMPREQAMTVRLPERFFPYATVDAVVPVNAPIVAALAVDDWDYPLYGPRLRRTPVEVQPEHAFEVGLPYVFIGTVTRPPIPPGWNVQYFPNGWLLAIRR